MMLLPTRGPPSSESKWCAPGGSLHSASPIPVEQETRSVEQIIERWKRPAQALVCANAVAETPHRLGFV